MRVLATLLVVVTLTAGCFGGTNGDDPPDTRVDVASAEAPWWQLGESWTIRFSENGASPRTTTLVNFGNNTFGDPEHFWLGITDRAESLEHVFFEVNPFLGRIHWIILAPHEHGMHATMYSWPLKAGQQWNGALLGRDWTQLTTSAEEDGTFTIRGHSPATGETISYDYDPQTHWFNELHIADASGAPVLDATVTAHATGATGTYHFLRGRDYFDTSDGLNANERAPFSVRDEGATSIAFRVDVEVTGLPAQLEFVDPSGRVVHREQLATGRTDGQIFEILEAPAPGEWTLRNVGGRVNGDIQVRGVIEYQATL